MALVTVNIIGQAITARYGTLNTGDVLRTDAEFARHLVEDCSAAEYQKTKGVLAKKPLASALAKDAFLSELTPPKEKIKKSKPTISDSTITPPQDDNDPTITHAAD